MPGFDYRRGQEIGRADMGAIAAEIEARLRAALAPDALEIIDDSESHRGHAGHRGSGESHFTLVITAAAFAGVARIGRQRLVYAALGDLVAPELVHAVVIKAYAPGEIG